MRQLVAFIKKEFLELFRTGKIYILLILFVMFGIMNPAIAKLTPWMFKMLSETMEEQGIKIAQIDVNAMTSWQQYYKNMSFEFIVLVVMFYGTVVSEIQKGTLINMFTKGLSRWKALAAKTVSASAIWSICYWMCFGITYGYNAYFWDNSIASSLGLAALGSYIFGLWLISIIILSSSVISSSIGVLLSTGGAYVLFSLISMVPDASGYLPTKLTAGYELVSGASAAGDYRWTFIVTALLILLNLIVGVVFFNKKRV
jgi:ABC-2 type transport system permease protein